MPSQLGLVVAPSVLPPGTSRLTYVRGAVGSPVAISVAVFAGCIGLGYAGAIGAVLAVLAVLVAGAHAASYRVVRRYVDRHDRTRAKARREARRLKLLHPTGSTRQQHYNELRVLVEDIERLDETEAARFELQDLLDHFVRLAVDHQRCLESLRLAGANTPLSPALADGELARSKRRRDLIQRRIRHRDECVGRMEKFSEELDNIDELIRLVAQRTACPALDADLEREVDRRLWEIEEVEAAFHQLSA
jgi:CHASE3 domain sensor protein